VTPRPGYGDSPEDRGDAMLPDGRFRLVIAAWVSYSCNIALF